MSLEQRPYISFIIAGRNDDYGGDFNDRLQNSIHSLSRWVDKYKLQTEYIIVNYNPVSDKKSLLEAIKWPNERTYLKIRIITVPNAVHEELRNPELRDPVPLYEYIAKNIGIRRAKGEYICAANPDIIYTPELLKFISKGKLSYDCYYRVDRCDFHKPAEINGSLPENVMSILKKNTFRVFMKGNTHWIHFPDFFDLRLRYLQWQNNKAPQYRLLENHYHCNCSGDFMLMHRDHWFKMEGHPENTLISAHTDALFVVMAATSGLREVILPWPVFHQNHERRYSCDSDEENPSVTKMYNFFLKEGWEMVRNKKPLENKNSAWGLAAYEFNESEI